MSRGRTLWEMLTSSFGDPLEFQYYNPLHARVGQAVQIDEVELRDLQFFIEEIREYRRVIDGRTFLFTDYEILAQRVNADDVWLRVRLSPTEDRGEGGVSHHVLLMDLDEDMGYDEGLHQALNAGTGVLEITDSGEKQTFHRVNDVRDPYKAVVTILKDENQDKRVDSDEVEKRRIEYWDYVREIKDTAGQPMPEYLFVEMDTRDGWFQSWRGRLIDPRRVALL